MSELKTIEKKKLLGIYRKCKLALSKDLSNLNLDEKTNHKLKDPNRRIRVWIDEKMKEIKSTLRSRKK